MSFEQSSTGVDRRGTCFLGRCRRWGLLWLVAVSVAVASQLVPTGRLISPGTPATFSITGGGQDSVEFEAPAGAYVRILVEPRGVRVAYRLFDPGGKALRDSRIWRGQPTRISFLSRAAGRHRLDFVDEDESGSRGTLTVRLLAVRPAAPGDVTRARAASLEAEAGKLREEFRRASTERALSRYEEAARLWASAGETDAAAAAYGNAAMLAWESSDLDVALADFDRALATAGDAGDQRLRSGLLASAGVVQTLQGRHEEGEARCRAALAMARQSQASRQEAAALDCLGEIEYHRGEHQPALDYYRRALALSRRVSDRRRVAETLLHLGYSSSDLSDFSAAKTAFEEALSGWKALGDVRGTAMTLVALGRLHVRIGEYQIAMNTLQEAEPMLDSLGDPLWQGSLSAALATVYDLVGRRVDAARRWDRAVELFHRTGVRLAEVDALNAAGEAHLNLGELDRALEQFQTICRLSRKINNNRFLALGLRSIGMVYNARGEYARALPYFRQSLDLLRGLDDPRLASYAERDAGEAHERRGELAEARGCYERAIRLSSLSRDLRGESIAHYRYARLLAGEGKLEEALRQIQDSLNISEQLREGVASYNSRTSYVAAIHQRQELYIDVLMRLAEAHPSSPYAATALEASERGRARTLLESLTAAGVDLQRAAPPELRRRRQLLRRSIDDKAERLMRLVSSSGTQDQVAALEADLRELGVRLDETEAEIRSRSPRYAALVQPEPLGLERIQRQVLDDDTVLLEYALGEKRSFLWVVGKSGLQSRILPPRAEIEARARRVYAMLTARMPAEGESVRDYRARVRQADAEYWNEAAALSKELLAPVIGSLGGKRLLIVADGALQLIPFGALPAPGGARPATPLLLAHEIVNLPSASAFVALRHGPSPSKRRMELAVFADPVFTADDPRLLSRQQRSPSATASRRQRGMALLRSIRQVGFGAGARMRIPRLAATRQEADAITAAAPPGRVFRAIGFAANLDTIRRAHLERFRIVHFATHGVLNSENPELSGILLSMFDRQGKPRSGFLHLDDIYNLDLPADLVVLSACSSALGQQIRGEGLVGLVRGFMQAGASRVVASLWKVDDEATGELMGRFYRQMFQHRLAPAAALREAQIEMWREREWKAPYYWAAFVLQGDWR